jgi:hypothetical protein
MMPSFEVLLPLGAVAFYLFDASLMLYGNELALEWRAPRWRVSGGMDAMLRGRRLFLPNPLTPHALLFQVRWDTGSSDASADPTAPLEQLDRSLAPVKGIVVALAFVLLAVLPPVSWLYGAGAMLLAVFIAAYLLIGVALVVVYRRRAALGLSPRRFAVLAFEALACAPFAVNLVRKISLLQSNRVELESFANQHFDESTHRAMATVVVARIDERLAVEEPETARSVELQAMRDRMRSPLRDSD